MVNYFFFVVVLGTLPNITRNALVNCTELVTYDLIKEAILRHKLMSGERESSVLCGQATITNTHTLVYNVFTSPLPKSEPSQRNARVYTSPTVTQPSA